jgi:hypothetical protein
LRVNATLKSGKRVYLLGELSETQENGKPVFEFRATFADLLQ